MLVLSEKRFTLMHSDFSSVGIATEYLLNQSYIALFFR